MIMRQLRQAGMRSFGRAGALALAVAGLVSGVAPPLCAVTIDWVTVGDPGNAPDTTGDPNPCGAVAEVFRIMKYEWTNSQYAAFLNAVDPQGTNPNSVYNASMGTDVRGGIIFNTAFPDGGKYAAKTAMRDKPVNFVSWFDAARVANWLHNGQGSGSTETGAYTLTDPTTGIPPAVNPGAKFFIPTEDQWYKAAYYKGGGTNAGYWNFATQSDSAPTAVSADVAGAGSAGSAGNFANYNAATWNGATGNVTTVGTNGGPGAYGTFDQSGNVLEWNDLEVPGTSLRGGRGGSWNDFGDPFFLSVNGRVTGEAATEADFVGFRLASPAPIPEIDPAGMGSVLALVASALALAERRRRAA